ncbi:MAG: polyprenyl synthetase family protein [Bacteroidetes bacterium]|nr:polyprenyl synthetase family protein [Bacteroidota bacterium]
MLSIKDLSVRYNNSFSVADFRLQPTGLYEPMEHIMAIPGKRIRPLLLLIACDAFGGDVQQALGAAHAMELFHNFSLVHDDIMDDATLRRGVDTVHEKFGLNAGILSGDALFAYAYKYLAQSPEAMLPSLFHVFTKAAIEILEGQQMDMDFEQRLDVTVDEYLKMIGYKTSVLLACSLQTGAIIGGASAEDQARLYDFGLKLGLSFQIKDDWLDTFGDNEKVGKKMGGDIIQNKKTLLLITLLLEAGADDRAALLGFFTEGDEAKKVAGVKALYARYQISEKTLAKADELYKEALQSLADISIADDQKANLYTMAKMIRDRDF